MKWSYGITTTIQRLGDLLPRTVDSLRAGGFTQPRLFVDGTNDPSLYAHFKLETTFRFPAVRTYGNWYLSLLELYVREATADYYALFQDDIVCCKNLKEYIENSGLPADAYFNPYCSFDNLARAEGKTGWFVSNQNGRGALALIFPKNVAVTLLCDRMWSERAQSDHGWKNIDGGITHSLSTNYWGKYKEYCHNPGLVQHTGFKSSIGTLWPHNDKGAIDRSPTFIGEDKDPVGTVQSTPLAAAPKVDIAQPSKQELHNHDLTTPWAVGDHVSRFLDAIGMSKRRVASWVGEAGCDGCWERQRRLNLIGFWAQKYIEGRIEDAKARIEELIS